MQPTEAADWIAINDGVMGGVSQGRVELVEGAGLRFVGVLSLANRGGFASCRCTTWPATGSMPKTLTLELTGDGRAYSINLHPIAAPTAFSYRFSFTTQVGVRERVEARLIDFAPVRFGRPVSDAPPLAKQELGGFGFLLGDKRSGPFELIIHRVMLD